MSRMIDSAGIQGNLGEDHRAMNKTLTELFGYIEGERERESSLSSFSSVSVLR